jgi:hypothetical protein
LSLNKPAVTTELEEEIKHFIYKSSVKLNEIDKLIDIERDLNIFDRNNKRLGNAEN